MKELLDLHRKHWKYLKYLVRHKWYVFQAGKALGAPLWRLLVHDLSKLRPSEWLPYLETFYGGPHTPWDEVHDFAKDYFHAWAWAHSKEGVQESFDKAWLLHQHRNPHHWQYWLLKEDGGSVRALPMPYAYVQEMVADWAGAGRAITGKWDLELWYFKNKAKMVLHPKTQSQVDSLVREFVEAVSGDQV